MAAPTPGREALIVGRYTLGDPVDSSVRGVVHVARAIKLARFTWPVALERVHAHLATDPHDARQVIADARFGMRISHRNVVGTLDVIETENELYIVTEYVHGVSLDVLLREAARRGEPVPIPVAVAIIADVLAGLGAAHDTRGHGSWDSAPIVHGELSPESILVGVDGIPCVRGFRTAPDRLTRYSAPEQRLGREYDHRADIYAAATILWEMLTGRKPPADDALIERPSVHRDLLPDAIDGVVLHGLAPNPAKRFATARQMGIALALYGTLAEAAEVGRWVEHTGKRALEAHAAAIESIGPTGPEPDDDRTTAPLISAEPSVRPMARRPPGAKGGPFVMGQ